MVRFLFLISFFIYFVTNYVTVFASSNGCVTYLSEADEKLLAFHENKKLTERFYTFDQWLFQLSDDEKLLYAKIDRDHTLKEKVADFLGINYAEDKREEEENIKEKLKYFYKKNVFLDPNVCSKHGGPQVIFYAISEYADRFSSDTEDLFFQLLERGANVNVKGAWNRTPLMHAAFRQTLPAIKMLLDYGAKIEDAHNDYLNILEIAKDRDDIRGTQNQVIRFLEGIVPNSFKN